MKPYLDRLYQSYDIKFLETDPLRFVHLYEHPLDREIVGLISSGLAYGRVAQIMRSVDAVLEVLGPKPSEFVMSFVPSKDGRHLDSFVHRMSTGIDIQCLIYFMRQMIDATGSIGSFFAAGYNRSDCTIKSGLVSFTERVLELDHGGTYGRGPLPENAGVRYFFPSPEKGSACKRLNLYLRWMVRRSDSLDLGLWSEVNPAALIIPLDTHVARISRYIGLTNRKSCDWVAAEDITNSLRVLDPEDPVKYDFAICRLGILEDCPLKRDQDKCRLCTLAPVCRV
jgi:uncharacterized protein (TIGR02757 family)